ncbi:MAG: hypothetical protein LBD55_05105 [Treponema sp.]|jgi:hypothetical protein|nr:hypothetical protein [Treponema sp.]
MIVKAFSPKRTDKALHKGLLPGNTQGGKIVLRVLHVLAAVAFAMLICFPKRAAAFSNAVLAF